MPAVFQKYIHTSEHGWLRWISLIAYGWHRRAMAGRLLKSLFRHPFTALANLRFWCRSRRRGWIHYLGVPDRNAFLAFLEQQLHDWRTGRTGERPRLRIYQAYCEKPPGCACRPSPESPYFRAGVQRRFNEFCVMRASPPAGCRGECRLTEMFRLADESGNDLQIEVQVMLNEEQLADFWEDQLARQARTGQIVPFIMDVCPLALWLARCSLFQLKTPVGAVFLFSTENRCRSFTQYRQADGGQKDSDHPVRLADSTRQEKESLLAAIRQLAGNGDIPAIKK